MTEGPEGDSHRVEAFALDLLKILHSGHSMCLDGEFEIQ
jgi:hypothetical protein